MALFYFYGKNTFCTLLFYFHDIEGLLILISFNPHSQSKLVVKMNRKSDKRCKSRVGICVWETRAHFLVVLTDNLERGCNSNKIKNWESQCHKKILNIHFASSNYESLNTLLHHLKFAVNLEWKWFVELQNDTFVSIICLGRVKFERVQTIEINISLVQHDK